MKSLEYIIQKTLSSIIAEQAPATPTAKETDNAPSDAVDSPFTPAEEKFLGKFDAYGTRHIGIIYSLSDIGIREFITRSGANLNISPDILVSLLRKKAIKIVPYTGFGRNDDYTIELQLSLDDVKGLGAEDKEKAEAGSSASGAPAAGGEATPPAPAGPGPEVAWVIPYGELIKESTKIAKQLITEKTKDKTKSKIQADKSRVMKRLPKGYINQLERIIDMIGKKTHNSNEKQRMVADILDNLSVNLKLSDKQIRKSFEFFKNQKRLQESIKLNEQQTTSISDADILNALNFWQAMDDSLNQFNWDEETFFKTMSTCLKNRNSAIAIDVIGIILNRAADPADTVAHKFLAKKASQLKFTGWASINVPIELDNKYASKSNVYTLSGIFDSYSIGEDMFDETDGWFFNLTGEPLINGIEKIVYTKSIGRLNYTFPNGMYTFYPLYNRQTVNTIVNQLLAPYKTKDVIDKEIAQKSKAVKSQIENNRKVYASDGMYNSRDDYKLETIHNINGVKVNYKGTWIDKFGKSYVWYAEMANPKNTYRLYADGTGMVVNNPGYKYVIGTTKVGNSQIRFLEKSSKSIDWTN